MDIRASGRVRNEYGPDGTTFTFGGTGAIYREYARRVQNDIHDKLRDWYGPRDKTATGCQLGWVEQNGRCVYEGFEIGDPACLLSPGQDPSTWKEAEGCTGFEQFVTPASPFLHATERRQHRRARVLQAVRSRDHLRPRRDLQRGARADPQGLPTEMKRTDMRIDLLQRAASALLLALPALVACEQQDEAASPDDDALPEPGALADNECRALAPIHSVPDDDAEPSLLGAINECAARSCPVACGTAYIKE